MSKSHGPAFVAGVIAGGLTVAVAQEREAEWRRWADWAEKRIAELEAGVERLRTERDMYEALWRKYPGVNPSVSPLGAKEEIRP